eukprot:MONOS_14893.1-p1 / transcript=MONOS_14893.1 / gene=MONOS_14893 / organism=Monocercomonoides_exilis_PA203 / gene_product=unspecified product / transcript_product=unspecified product / location=Mono_scaffold01099:3583-4476(-) / protein_length=298 / sequence_SO=supercontig / SO=protein_coding / is_pseudo=false
MSAVGYWKRSISRKTLEKLKKHIPIHKTIHLRDLRKSSNEHISNNNGKRFIGSVLVTIRHLQSFSFIAPIPRASPSLSISKRDCIQKRGKSSVLQLLVLWAETDASVLFPPPPDHPSCIYPQMEWSKRYSFDTSVIREEDSSSFIPSVRAVLDSMNSSSSSSSSKNDNYNNNNSILCNTSTLTLSSSSCSSLLSSSSSSSTSSSSSSSSSSIPYDSPSSPFHQPIKIFPPSLFVRAVVCSSCSVDQRDFLRMIKHGNGKEEEEEEEEEYYKQKNHFLLLLLLVLILLLLHNFRVMQK